MVKIDRISNEHEKHTIRELKKKYNLSDKDYNIDERGHVIKISLSNKNLEKIPDFINELKQLKILNLSHNKISKIEGLNNLSKLKKLNLHANIITHISGLENLIQLKDINLLRNQINKIEGLDNLTRLQRLNLYNNQIKKLEGLGNLTQLSELQLSNNPLLDEDKKIYEKGLKTIIEYCKKNE